MIDHENIKIKVEKSAEGIQIMGKEVPSWQTFISCNGGSLIIRHLKSGLAEDLEIPWPAKLKRITCEKVQFRVEDLHPLSEYVKTLDTVEMKDCEFAEGVLSVLAGMSALRYLSFENCGISDADLNWFRGMPKLSGLVLAGNPGCSGAVVAAANASPLERLDLKGTGFQDKDIPLLLSFPQLGHLNLSDTKVTGAVLSQLAVNRNLNIICGHDRNGIARFRAVQRNNWKKELAFDAEPAEEAMEAVRHFYKVSQDSGQPRSSLVTVRYLDYCRAHGYNGVDVGQKVSFSDSSVLPYQGYQVVDVEQITRKKFYVYSESDDVILSQYRCLVIQTEDGWKIDKNERLTDGKWKFRRLD